MDKITLIASDFDDINLSLNPGVNCLDQYAFINKCPIAKALKRAGIEHENLDAHFVKIGGVITSIEGGRPDVERCRLELLAGASEAYITVVNQ